MKILADYHHGSLLRSLVMLFEDRLGMELYRPIGLEWWERGYWAVSDRPEARAQYLSSAGSERGDGSYLVPDPGGRSSHRACTFEYFTSHRFDYVLASLPAHVPRFEALISKYQPRAKLIVQLGNNWNVADYRGHNVLASIAPRYADGVNALFYHQEFELDIFAAAPCLSSRRMSSYVNLLPYWPSAWDDFQRIKNALPGFDVRSYGGGCPDGVLSGPAALADSMRAAQIVFHVKPGGDGFGHVIHNAYAMGRPIITRPSHYRHQLAEALLAPGTFFDLDRDEGKIAKRILALTARPEELHDMGARMAARFREVVNYDREAGRIGRWIERLP